jgi:hypothetical protein
MPRRAFVRNGSIGAAALVMGGGALLLTACDPVALGAPDALGLKLPPGFTARVVATTGETVGGTSHVWHVAPDGGATFPLPDGGWSYVSNGEWVPGGVDYIRFDASGAIVDAGVSLPGDISIINCAGGATPWGTWLSCEELPTGRVWECDPIGASPALERLAMGRFAHEAAAADPTNEVIYMTEDVPDSALYRFVPDTWGDLSSGVLEVLTDPDGKNLEWATVPDPLGSPVPTRNQVPDTLRFDGGEGCDMSGDTLLFTTKGDGRVWSYNTLTNKLGVMYDQATDAGVLTNVDNLVVSDEGVTYVAEDGGDLQLVLVRKDGSTFPVLQLCDVPGTEITGPAFDPSGTRLYFSSQRNPGTTYEIEGPFFASCAPARLRSCAKVPALGRAGVAVLGAALAAAALWRLRVPPDGRS